MTERLDATTAPAPMTPTTPGHDNPASDLHTRLAQVEEQNRQLWQALESARDIGAAIGIVMSCQRLTRTAAFERLTALSQRSNRKLHDIALDIVDTGEVPG
ncbi:MAG: hypothetical protein JWP82_1690 [Humibacillus sp.]|nr:hypothetical protein [Humibacillus sp.]